MHPEFILLAVGVGLTVLAGIVVFASMRRSATPTSRGDSSAAISITLPHAGPMLPDSPVVSADKLILRGLQSLLEREPREAFVVFEHPGTKHFVQFVRTDAGVMLDLPLSELGDDERSRASAIFAAHGLPVTQIAGETPPAEIFQADFGGDADRATRVAMDVFRKVFALDGDFPLYVKTE